MEEPTVGDGLDPCEATFGICASPDRMLAGQAYRGIVEMVDGRIVVKGNRHRTAAPAALLLLGGITGIAGSIAALAMHARDEATRELDVTPLPWQVVYDDALGSIGFQMPDGKWLGVFFESLGDHRRYTARLQVLVRGQMKPVDASQASSPTTFFMCVAALVLAVLGVLLYVILRRG